MAQRSRLSTRNEFTLNSHILGIFDGKPGRPYLMIGLLLMIGAVVAYLISALVAINAIPSEFEAYGDDTFTALTRVRRYLILSTVIKAGAALRAIPGTTLTILGIVQFHNACLDQSANKRDESNS